VDRLENMVAGPAWLTSILVNTCRDRLRARAQRPQQVSFDEAEDFSLYQKIADEDPYPYSDSLHLDFLGEFGPEDVRAVLASLPDLYRIPLMLTYMDGFATKEVAGMLGAPVGTVLAGSYSRRRCGSTRRSTDCSVRARDDHLRRGGQATLGVPRRHAR
jgi:RNA polymerase sigma-70 factor, ECF subfamily